ncbi:hypothetical protein IM793_22885 [Pedobacter sp. MR2016-19]|uniref:hypothetical protein n=1 Tax=Pedobacter sp. MR2016-19 TaxID=2780089 RepID=UPI001874367E|nr:hypothetical protein [Pedobacter sp. MR2016-19]MBE5322019.1 hypothetical protein [Pedobacter sp. MR2016-19]
MKNQALAGISQNNAFFTAEVISSQNISMFSLGVCWSTTPGPTTANSKSATIGSSPRFSVNLTGLSASTRYYARGYVITNYETIYSNELQFTTLNVAPSSITTNSVSGITVNSAVSGGNVLTSGGGTVTQRGICWNTLGSPTTSNSRTTDASGVGPFTSSLTGLLPSTTYYVRAYAVNQNGTSYGNQIQFTTSSVTPPTISTSSVSNITRTSASSGGNLIAYGSGTASSKGICWNTLSSPTISDSRTLESVFLGAYSSNMSGLRANTTYYVRAYVVTNYGIYYGTVQQFKTSL